MSYTPNTWKSGDVVTSAKLNNMEQGIANAGAMIAHDNSDTLDKTWQEVHDAAPLVWLYNGENYAPLVSEATDGNTYFMMFFNVASNVTYVYLASSADEYPVLQPDG